MPDPDLYNSRKPPTYTDLRKIFSDLAHLAELVYCLVVNTSRYVVYCEIFFPFFSKVVFDIQYQLRRKPFSMDWRLWRKLFQASSANLCTFLQSFVAKLVKHGITGKRTKNDQTAKEDKSSTILLATTPLSCSSSNK